MSGWAKAAWLIFVIVLPYLGVFTYLIVRGRRMTENSMDEARRHDEAFRAYVQDAAGAPASTGVDQLSTLASMRADGVISDDEFERMKAKVTTT